MNKGQIALLGLLMLGMSVMAHADTAPNPATGTGPGLLDYGLLTGQFTAYVQPIVTQSMPYCIVLMGLFMAPMLGKRLIHAFAHG